MELPEVEVLRRDLDKAVVGKKIGSAEVRSQKNAMKLIGKHHRTRKDFEKRVEGRKIVGIERKGKYLLIRLDDEGVIVAHFGMSGRLFKGTKRHDVEPHTHIVLEFTTGGDLRFIDPRVIGKVFVTTESDLPKAKELAKVGIDPLEHGFTWPEFSQKLASRKQRLKTLLLDQEFVAGLGNIYSDEALFVAGLRWDRKSDELSSQEVRRLYRAIQEVVTEAIRYRGTTLEDRAYLDLAGKAGEHEGELRVYGRKGEPCRRCRSPIESVRVANRTSYFCPVCQT